MINPKVKMLIVERDKGRVEMIKHHLSNDFYDLESVKTLDDALSEVLAEEDKPCEEKTRKEYDAVFFRIGFSTKEGEVEEFLGNLRKNDIPIIIAKSKDFSTTEINEILSGKKYEYIQTDCVDPFDELYELEWAVVKLVPKALYCFKTTITSRIDSIEKIEKDYSDMKSKISKIQEEIKTFKARYVSWDRILEPVSMFVGAFSVAIGIVVSFILLFFDKKGSSTGPNIYFGHLLAAFVLVILICGVSQYFFLKRKIVKMVEEKFGENIKNKVE